MKDIKIIKGVAKDWKGEPVLSGADLLQGNCECGIDCCYGYLRLPNYNSNSGDTETYALYIVDGELVIEPEVDAKAAIKAFKANTLISATSVTLTGCLLGTDLVEATTRQLTAVVNPTGSLQTGVWTSNEIGLATVSSTGLVTAVSEGVAIITFTSTDGGFTGTCAINVIPTP